MRAAVVQLPNTRTARESRQVLRAAIRQLERAEIYFDAAAAMQLNDRDARRALDRLRADSAALRRYLGDQSSALRE
jgi:Holliday junction resolvasome RuvABC ATP-dependent DNA helicase subunit